MTAPVDLVQLTLEFARLGLVSFGGTNLAEMERVLVGEHAWISAETLGHGFALGQLMPGPNMLAVTHYGYAAAGMSGAGAATLGFYGPTALLSAAAALGWKRLQHHPQVVALRSGLLPFGAGILLASTLVLAQSSVQGWATAAIASVTFVLLQRTRVNSALLVLGAALLGYLLGL